MKVWLIRSSEPMPIIHPDSRLFRMGLIAKELDKRKHNITWFASTFDHYQKNELSDKSCKVKITDNYSIELIWSPMYKKNISIKRIINHAYLGNEFYKKINSMEKPDVILASFPIIELAEKAVKYGKKNNIPVIIDVRDLWPDIFKHNLTTFLAFFAKPYIYLMTKKTEKLMKNAYGIISISPAMLEWGIKKAEREKRKTDKYFYMGYENENEKEIKAKYEGNIKIDKSKLNICYVGSITMQLDLDLLIKLINNLKEYNDINFIICGDGPRFKELKNKTEGLNNVEMLGWIGKSDLNYVMENSSFGIAPYNNSFDFQMSVSNKFSEYLSRGLPVIITSEGYMKELLEENKCGVASIDPDKIAKFIIEIINDREKYNEMSNNALKLYNEKFVAEKIYSDLADYLENIVEVSKNNE